MTLNEQQSKDTQEQFYQHVKTFLDEKGLEDKYGIGYVQAVQYRDDEDETDIGSQISFIWQGEKGLHAKVGLEVAGGLFNLAIQIIHGVSKDENIAKTTIMAIFAKSLSQALGEMKEEAAAAE